MKIAELIVLYDKSISELKIIGLVFRLVFNGTDRFLDFFFFICFWCTSGPFFTSVSSVAPHRGQPAAKYHPRWQPTRRWAISCGLGRRRIRTRDCRTTVWRTTIEPLRLPLSHHASNCSRICTSSDRSGQRTKSLGRLPGSSYICITLTMSGPPLSPWQESRCHPPAQIILGVICEAVYWVSVVHATLDIVLDRDRVFTPRPLGGGEGLYDALLERFHEIPKFPSYLVGAAHHNAPGVGLFHI
jgi:hypothetical protein